MADALSRIMLDLMNDLGVTTAVWLSRSDDSATLIGYRGGERWAVEADELYSGVCELAEQIGVELSDG